MKCIVANLSRLTLLFGRKCWQLLLALLCFVPSLNVLSKEYKVYSYHSDPPFRISNAPTDLSSAWVSEFNRRNKEDKMVLVNIERKELNTIVASGQPYIILWANALWFEKRDSKVKNTGPIFWDADVWVSLKDKSVKYYEPQDLSGLRIGGRTGYYYKGIEELVQVDEIKRTNSTSDMKNYKLLKNGKVDVFVMSRSSLLYWVAHGFDDKEIYVAQSPHDAFTRHVLFSHHYGASLSKKIDTLIAELKTDEDWKKRLKFWGIKGLVGPFELELEELMSSPVEQW